MRGLTELVIFACLAVAYNVVRAQGGVHKALAIAHAEKIHSLEGPIYSHLEHPLNHAIVHVTTLAVAACYFYALMHYVMTPTILLVSRHRGGRQYWRGYTAIVLASAIALVIYATFPTAPPRLTPGIGAIDVMQQFSHFGWWGSAASAPRGIGDATNQYAAMPSLHFGWSLWCGIQMWGFGSKRWRIAAVAYPTIQVFVVLATANHFLLDVLAGGACVVVAYAVVTPVVRLLDRGNVSVSVEQTRD